MSLNGLEHSKPYAGSLSPTVIGVILVVIGLAAAFALNVRHGRTLTEASQASIQRSNSVDSSASRSVFPLSVIPGGAYSKEELARARRSDAVVAGHYAGFGSSPEFRKLAKPELMYVSYRRGDKVFWSQNKHLIRQGETIISDGNCMARARCGNRLSATPQGPVAPKEPTEEVLNTPEIPEEPVSYKLTDLPGPAPRSFDFNLPSALASANSVPAAPGQAKAAAGLPGPNTQAAYFAPGPGGVGGGSGPATAGTKTSTTAATANTPISSLPTSTTGGSTLPVASSYPVSGPSPAPVPNAPAELVPEPGPFSYMLLAGVPAALWLLRRLRFRILPG